MSLLFLIHHGLNAYWHENLLKGRYSLVRGLETMVDILLFAGMVLQGSSSFLMSRHVFAFIEGRSGMAFARTVHMLCAYWLFILMGIHLGFHGGRILTMARKLVCKKEIFNVWIILLRIAAILTSGYGVYALWKRQLGSYLFILTKNPCYTAGRKITVKGLMLHSVGCPQPKASVFINSWNSASYDSACVHGFIDGNDGTVYQTLPWNHRGWHCGSGSRGSGNNTHIGVEMCEPACMSSALNCSCSANIFWYSWVFSIA